MRAVAPSGGWCWHACRGDQGWPAGGRRGPRPRAVLGPPRGAIAGCRHLRVRPARPGRLLPLHRAHGLRRRARARTRRPIACSGTSSARRSSSTAPTPPGRCPWGRGSAPCPSSWDRPAWSRSAIPTSTRARWPSTWCSRSCCCLPVPDALSTDLAALTEPLAVGEHAVGLAGLAEGQPCLVVGCGPVGLAVIAALQGSRPRPGAGRRLLPDPSPPGRGLRGRRGHRPRRGLARTTAGPTSASPGPSWSASDPPCSAPP